VADQPLDDVRRMLAVAVHEQHRAAPGVVQAGHERGLLAEIARQRHHLNIERIGGKGACDREGGVGAAVVDINDLAAKAVAPAKRRCQFAEPLMQRCQPGRLVVQRHDDRQPLRSRSGRSG
jgi:hypothetical protein